MRSRTLFLSATGIAAVALATGHFILTYRYEAGVSGAQYGQCEIDEPSARQLVAGSAGRVRVDPMHPARSDWLGAAPSPSESPAPRRW